MSEPINYEDLDIFTDDDYYYWRGYSDEELLEEEEKLERLCAEHPENPDEWDEGHWADQSALMSVRSDLLARALK